MEKQQTQSHEQLRSSVYHTRRWRRLRLEILKRDQYICQKCKRICHGSHKGSPSSPECDHIVDIVDDYSLAFEPTNLQTLCKSCHIGKKSNKTRHGYTGDGKPLDPDHHWNSNKQ